MTFYKRFPAARATLSVAVRQTLAEVYREIREGKKNPIIEQRDKDQEWENKRNE